jgi:DNA-binding transcriptional ArsR family regulator
MVVMSFRSAALAELRLAISPLTEAVRSVRALEHPTTHTIHLPWIADARERTRDLDLAPLRALQPPGSYAPDFLNPPPTGPLDGLEDGLNAMLRTPPGQIAQEVQNAYPNQPVPESLEAFLDHPSAAIASLADLLRDYWDRALAEHWPRIKSVLHGDILYRATKLAEDGPTSMIADIDRNVSWSAGALRIQKECCTAPVEIADAGLLLVPSAFVWPEVLVAHDPNWPPMLIYPARGIGALWQPTAPARTSALASLLGKHRSAVLLALDRPRSTTDLAHAIGITPGGISQHLTILSKTGLVYSNRVGRVVLYARSATGDALIGAAPKSEPAATLQIVATASATESTVA